MGQGSETASERAEEWPEQLAVRAAWCYHMLGLTQAEVAERLDIPRMRVNRLLAEARERGLVTISINSALTENIALEEALCRRFPLAHAHVVLADMPASDPDEAALAGFLGRAAAPIIARRLKPGMTIGSGWGVTMKSLATAMKPQAPRGLSVVSMVGSLDRRSAVDVFEAATLLAQKLSAECFYLAAPLICDSPESRRAIMAQPAVEARLEQARRADIAVLSIGAAATGTLSQAGLLTPRDVAELLEAGAVGNVLGHSIDAVGRVVDHPLNHRVVGLHPEDLRGVGHRVMVSGGPAKLKAIRAVLRAGLASEIVTDQDTARHLVTDDAVGDDDPSGRMR